MRSTPYTSKELPDASKWLPRVGSHLWIQRVCGGASPNSQRSPRTMLHCQRARASVLASVSREMTQLLHRASQRPASALFLRALAATSSGPQHVRPQVADLGDARGHRPQREGLWADFDALDLVPCAWR